jgi:hypothetical protein
MKYKVTVVLSDFKYLPTMPKGEEITGVLRGKCFSWESDIVNTLSLQNALQRREITSFKVTNA